MLHFSNEIFLLVFLATFAYFASYHWSFSLLLPFINMGRFVTPTCSFKLRKLTSGYVFEEKLEENAAGMLAEI